jgi:hypothetical protein
LSTVGIFRLVVDVIKQKVLCFGRELFITNMKKVVLISLFAAMMFSCQSKKYDVSSYFSDNQRDTLLANIITYVYIKPSSATNSTRFDAQYRQFYVKNLPSFRIEKYYPAADGWHYFLLVRPVGNSPNYRRGVLGKFKLKKAAVDTDSLMPEAFEEIINTPHLEEKTVVERGSFLFQELVKKGNLNDYLAMKHYIEWPDATLVYDKNINEWVGRSEQSTVGSQQSTEVEK